MIIPVDLARKRLYQQRLIANACEHPEEVVSWLGAVQAQEYPGAVWSLAMRMDQATEALIEQAFNAGRILRTHIMRPTWHFVTPEDIRWIMALTAPRVRALNASTDRQLELDDALFARCLEIIGTALEGGKNLTRNEISEKLAENGILAEGQRMSYIMHRAELDLLVCSGPRRGKQFTYALVDERVPAGRDLQPDEALAELTLRYFTGHGPATEQDFARWSGLTLTDARTGIEMQSSQLESTDVEDETYWFSVSQPPIAQPSTSALLIPRFDEYYVGYSSYGKAVNAGRAISKNFIADPPIVIDGRIVGTWRRTLKKKAVIVEITPFDPLTTDEQTAIIDAAEQYGHFLGLSADPKIL